MRSISRRSRANSHSGNLFLIFFVALILLFFALRLFRLPDLMGFGTDEGRDFLTVWSIYTERNITLVGPPSQYTINGRQFFFGPAPFYLILPALVIGNWDPLSVSYYLITLNALILGAVILFLWRFVRDKTTLLFFAILCTVTPVVVTYTRSYWNPHFMLPISLLLIAVLVFIQNRPRVSPWWYFAIGILFGLGLQFHYSFVFAMGISSVWLLKSKYKDIKKLVAYVVGGVLVGFSPIIVFEFAKGFYNLQTLIMVFTQGADGDNDFTLHIFYFISVLPFVFLLISFVLARLKPFSYIFVAGYAVWAIWTVTTMHAHPLNYPVLKQLTSTIQSDNPTQFNIADQMTLDNRAMALRYFLTVSGKKPLGVAEYAESTTLYIYSPSPLETLRVDPVYEISTFKTANHTRTWEFENGIKLYKLEK